MSEPITELLSEYRHALLSFEVNRHERAQRAYDAIEREVAALRERAERAIDCKGWTYLPAEGGALPCPASWQHDRDGRRIDARDVTPQRIAALEAENAANAGRVDSLKAAIELLNGNLELFKADVKRLEAERDTLEAENAALMSAGKAITSEFVSIDRNAAAFDVFDEQPGALAAWMAREGR